MKFPVLTLLFLLVSFQSFCQSPDTTVKKVIVGIKEAPPFIIKAGDNEYRGLSIDLWEEIASQLGVTFKYKTDNLQGLLSALGKGDIDICINPLTVTSNRIEKMTFTQPFYITNLAIATTKTDENHLLIFIKNIFSIAFLKAVLLLFLVIFIFGFVTWLFERHKNKDQFGHGLKGLWDGIWWSAVTMTTVGYGDKAPSTVGGKIVGLVWMFTAIIIISGFTASIASSLTIDRLSSKIKDPNDLRKFKTGTVMHTTSAAYLRDKGIAYEGYATAKEGIEALNNGDIEAFVYDEPIMRYYIHNLNTDKLVVLSSKFNTQYYSFALPKNNPLADKIDPVLLQNIEDVTWKALLNRYNLLE